MAGSRYKRLAQISLYMSGKGYVGKAVAGLGIGMVRSRYAEFERVRYIGQVFCLYHHLIVFSLQFVVLIRLCRYNKGM